MARGEDGEIRADAARFALPAIYEYREAEGISYTIMGLVPNPRLEALAAPLALVATVVSMAAGMRHGIAPKARLVSEASPTRREAGAQAAKGALHKAEVLKKGRNTRFVVTNRPEDAQTLYDRYVERGETENRIKDYKDALRADRLSRLQVLGQPV